MRSLRIFLALLIALALPMQALADMRMAVGCCPMAEQDAAHPQSSAHDCCHEDDAGTSGKHCDAGSGCHCSAHLALALELALSPALHERMSYRDHRPIPTPSSPPATLWRPPALPAALT